MLSLRKILQALYYIQKNAPSKNEARFAVMYLLKIIYMSDRYHLRHFGITATGDSYVAMEYGPVASTTKNFLQGKSSNSMNSAEISLLSEIENLSEYNVSIKLQADDELSDSFKEALDFAIREFGEYDQFVLSEITHEYPDWKKHEDQLARMKKEKKSTSIPMDFVDFFKNPSSLVYLKKYGKKEDPFKEDQEFLNLLKEDFYAATC